MGFNDVSIHGSNQIPTPNIDSLGIFGIQLNGMYVAQQCTPSRTSLLTGKYSSTLGMQEALKAHEPYGLDLREKTIAQYMKEGGYSTHLIGKWHLGFFEKQYTPTFRGFDTHFGYLGGLIDYYNHSFIQPSSKYVGFDMRNNLEVSWETMNQYATDLFTENALKTIQNHNKSVPMFMILSHLAPHAGNSYDPLQAPEDVIRKFDYIQNKKRRNYAAMVSKLDESVGNVVKALETNNMLEDTIILFMPDNGAEVLGSYANVGSNYPFRGQKGGPWQGAVRSAAAIWSSRLQSRQRVSNQMIHITDWFATFVKLAGVEVNGNIDGMNVWDALSYDLPSPRKEMLVQYDSEEPFMAYISENFKLIYGSTFAGMYDGWLYDTTTPTEEDSMFSKSYSNAILSSAVGQTLLKYSKTKRTQFFNETTTLGFISKEEIDEIRQNAQVTCKGFKPPAIGSNKSCDPLVAPCLFDIFNDPCETTNLASEFPNIISELKLKLEYYANIAAPNRDHITDQRCNPANFGGVWTWWYDELNLAMHSRSPNSVCNSKVLALFSSFFTILCSFIFIS